VFTRVILLAAAVLAVAAPAPAGAVGLKFVEPDKVSLTPDSSGTQTEPVSVWVSNSTTAAVTPRFTAALEDGDAKAATKLTVKPPSGEQIPEIPAGDEARIRVVVSGITASSKLSGQLVAKGANGAPGSVKLSIAPKPDFKNRERYILVVALLLAAAVVGMSWVVGNSSALDDPLTKADLDFSAGFASTLTVVAALLAAVISAGVLPDETEWLSKDTYVALNVIFGALIACASLAFGAFQLQRPDGFHGYVGAFLLAAALTAWAAFGELATLWFLIWDINGTKGFSQGGVRIFQGILGFSFVAMLVYIAGRVYQITTPPKSRAVADEPTGPASVRGVPRGLL
jgi:hypothetical protein